MDVLRGSWTLVSLSLRLKDLLGPVTRVKKKKKKKRRLTSRSSRSALNSASTASPSPLSAAITITRPNRPASKRCLERFAPPFSILKPPRTQFPTRLGQRTRAPPVPAVGGAREQERRTEEIQWAKNTTFYKYLNLFQFEICLNLSKFV